MEPPIDEVARLFTALEELRLLMASRLPASPASQKKSLSWDDVWAKPYSSAKPTSAPLPVAGERKRLSEQYTRALRTLRLTNN